VQATGPIDLELRFEGEHDTVAVPARRVRLVASDASGSVRDLASLVVPATGTDEWQVEPASVTLDAGERLVIQAEDAAALQSVRGFVPMPPLPAGWKIGSQTDDAVVLEKSL
jgi:hypothetical protein